MTSEYNKLLFTSENTDYELINYYMSNEDKDNPFIKYLPKNAVSQDIINTPIYQEIHTGYNPHSKSMKSLDVSNNNNNINEYKTKSEYFNIDSPDIIDCEITMEDDYCLNKGNSNNNIINDYKFYSKSPKCNKNINSIHFDDLSLYSTNKNQYQNKARSPKIVRKNYFKLDSEDDLYNFNDNNDLLFEPSNPLSKSYARSPSPPIINTNSNINILKDSFSTNNIHPINNFQYQNNINSFQKKNLYKKQMSISPPNKQHMVLSNYKNKNQIDINSNNFTSSTRYSRSPNLKKYNYSNSLLSNSITGFPNKVNTNNNNNLAYTSSNANLENYQYLIDNPVPNTFNSVLNVPDSDANDNINNIYNNSQYNYLLNNRDNNSKNIILTPSKLYKPKFPKSNINNNQYIQKYALSPFPKNVNTFINTNNNINSINAYPNKKTIYQYNFQKSLSPKNIQYKTGNNIISTNSKKNKNENILNSNNKYIPNIKSSLPKISNFSKDISKKEFLSNNINDISFGDNNNIENNLKNTKIFGISSHKSISGENSISLKNDFNPKNLKKSKKLSNNQNEFSDINVNKSKIDTLKAKNKFSKKVVNKRSFNYFSKFMFESINKIRANPQSFIMNLKNAINNIAYDKKGNLYYNGNIKVALSKGKLAFEEAISFLEKARPMKPLIYKKELCVDIPEKQKDFESGDYLRKIINKMVMKGISVRAFWRDIIKDPQINFLLMVVDDNFIRRGAKRKDILNPDMKYIGINSASMGDNFVCYTVLSDE